MTAYQRAIASRSTLKFILGLIPRGRSYLKRGLINYIARYRGATIGQGVTMPYLLAKNANANLVVGDHSSIQTSKIDLRTSVTIGNHVIIGADVEIITVSHNIDSPDWERKYYGLRIEDFAWLATRAFVLPSCRYIGRGAVCAAGSVIAKDVEPMAVMVDNPAEKIRNRKQVHSDLCVESQLGNDLIPYINAYMGKGSSDSKNSNF